jgi:hypothetical protein
MTANVLSAGPANTAAPAISGTARVGSALNVSTGSWNSTPTSYAYQWQVGFGNGWITISGATGASFTPAQGQLGGAIRAGVTATNAGGSTTAWSAMSASVAASSSGPANTAVPVISATPRVGTALTVSTGSWSPAPTSYAYQWQVGFGNGWITISGATSSTFRPTQSQFGGALRAGVTATTAAGSTTTWTAMTANVASSVGATVAPAISGSAEVGAVLTADTGSWSEDPTGYTYQWQRQVGSGDWTDIPGATDPTYTVTDDDAGALVHVAVTAITADGPSTAYSLPTSIAD